MSSIDPRFATGPAEAQPRDALDAKRPHVEDDGTQVAILPQANVVKIGAQSLVDRGRSAVFRWSRSSVPTRRRTIATLDPTESEHGIPCPQDCRTVATPAVQSGLSLGSFSDCEQQSCRQPGAGQGASFLGPAAVRPM